MSSEYDFSEIDLSRHDFDALRDDINDIVDIPRAVGQLLRWSVLIPLIGTWLTWVVFSDRMSTLALIPYSILVAAALLLAALGIGGLVVMRSRVVEVNEAADRVIATVAALHGDYSKIRTSGSEVDTRGLAAVLAREIVFPALLSTGGAALNSSVVTGPIAFLARPLLKYPLAIVEERVLDVLLQDDVVLEPHLRPSEESEPGEVGADLVVEMAFDDLPEELANWYRAIHRYLTSTVAGVGTVAVGSMWTVVVLSALPAVVLLGLGWVLT